MADLVIAAMAGLLGGVFSGSASGIVVFEYQARRQVRMDGVAAVDRSRTILAQIGFICRMPSIGDGRTRRRAVVELLGDLGRALPAANVRLGTTTRPAYQVLLVQMGDLASPTRTWTSVASQIEAAAARANQLLG